MLTSAYFPAYLTPNLVYIIIVLSFYHVLLVSVFDLSASDFSASPFFVFLSGSISVFS